MSEELAAQLVQGAGTGIREQSVGAQSIDEPQIPRSPAPSVSPSVEGSEGVTSAVPSAFGEMPVPSGRSTLCTSERLELCSCAFL